MAMRRTRQVWVRLWAAALAAIAVACALPLSAQAQFFGDRWGFDQPYRQPAPRSRSFFSFPFFSRPWGGSANQPQESYRAPSPRKPETPPTTTVAVIGDSMADWLAYGLEEVYADQPQIGIVRLIRPSSGLIHYEPRNDTLEWSQAVKDALAAQKPVAIVVMLGLNDRVPLRPPAVAPAPPVTPAPARDGKPPAPAPGQAAQPPQQTQEAKPAAAGEAEQKPDYESSAERTEVAEAAHPGPGGTFDFHTDEWAKLYAKRIDEMIAVLKSKGVPVIWVGLPALRGPKATADMSYLDDLYRTEADKAGIIYVDIWDGFVDENGRYSVEGPDFEGQIRRLRTGDGVHFTKYGALKLAHLVDQELGRILANPVATAVLPSPEAAAPAKPGAVRPAIGPVLPLTTAGGAPGAPLNSETGGLLGGGSHTAPIASEDPTAEKVLVHGDALAPPVGRADNFSWPPGEEAAAATPAAAKAKPAPAAAQAVPAPGAATAPAQGH
jgi:uncharacterized protein